MDCEESLIIRPERKEAGRGSWYEFHGILPNGFQPFAVTQSLGFTPSRYGAI